jgi:uncharacterized membrane protein YqjE
MSVRKTIAGAAGDVVAIVRTRIELFGLEFTVETSRLFGLLGLACAAMLCVTLSAVVFSVLIIAYFWDTPQRLVAIVSLAVLYGLVGAWLLATLCKRLRSASQPFDATLQELKRDLQMFSLISHAGSSRARAPAAEATHKDAQQRHDQDLQSRSEP